MHIPRPGKFTVFQLALVGLTLVTARTRAQSIYTPYAFTNFAGLPGASGTNDGASGAARFADPNGIAVDNAGNVYVADEANQTIRKITSAGLVTTLAGSPGQRGSADGTNSVARFNNPEGVAVDSAGSVFVADRLNSTIRKITSDGVVTTLAGGVFQFGTNDGNGSDARFSQPIGVAVDSGGSIYVGDTGNHTIRKLTPSGTNWTVTTLAGSAGLSGTNDGVGTAARFYLPAGLAVDGASNIYVSDFGNYTIRKISPGGVVTTLAGSPGQYGSADGIGGAARFGVNGYHLGTGGAESVTVDSAGNVYAADTSNHTIRKITPWAAVTTLAGGAGQYGSADGIGSTARFDGPYGVAVDTAGNIYVADLYNSRITKGTPLLQFDTGARSLRVSDGAFHAYLIGPFYSNAVVDASEDLQSWMPIQTNIVPPEGVDLSLPLGSSQHQFFRARLEP